MTFPLPCGKLRLTMKLKSKITNFLLATGQKPYQLADTAGVPRTSVYRFLRGDRSISLETAERIQAVMDTDPASDKDRRCRIRRSA